MHRFLVPARHIGDREARIGGSEAAHLYRVLRLRPGDIIEISDGEGRAYRAELTQTTPKMSLARLLGPILADREPAVRLILAQALVKGDKMDLVIQKGTELGVHTFVPFACERAVVKLTEKKASQRRDRWERIAREAAKQCGRPFVPRVEQPLDLEGVLARFAEKALVILPWEGEESQGLRTILQDALHGVEPAVSVVLIGPEGGFAPKEIALAKGYGARVVSLGPRILRTETAALAAITMILYELGDLGGPRK